MQRLKPLPEPVRPRSKTCPGCGKPWFTAWHHDKCAYCRLDDNLGELKELLDDCVTQAAPFPEPDEDVPDLPELRTLASIVAAPVWAFVWVLTLGRMGKPLWRTDPWSKACARFRRGFNLTSEPGPIVVPPVAYFGGVEPPEPWPRPGGGYQPTHGGDNSNPPQSGSGVSPPPIPPPDSDPACIIR